MPHGHSTHGVLGGSIKDRVRPANAAELGGIPWLPTLTPAERRRAEAALVVGEAEPGDLVCRVGRSPTYWFGVVEGLLKMSNDNADGGSVTYTGVPPGGWFGEGTVMKREPYRYNIQALRRSVVAGLPIDGFHWLDPDEEWLKQNRSSFSDAQSRIVDAPLGADPESIDPLTLPRDGFSDAQLRIVVRATRAPE